MSQLLEIPIHPDVNEEHLKSMLINIDYIICLIVYDKHVAVKLDGGVMVATTHEGMERIMRALEEDEETLIPDAYRTAFPFDIPDIEPEPKDIFEGDNFWERYGTEE